MFAIFIRQCVSAMQEKRNEMLKETFGFIKIILRIKKHLKI